VTTKEFQTTHGSAGFWEGFARQTIDCQHAVGELIDNALSAPLPNAAGTGLQPAVVEAEALACRILQVELAVVVGRQMPCRKAGRGVRVEAPVEEPARVAAGQDGRSAGPPSSTKRRSQ